MGLKEGAVRGGVRNVSTGISAIPDTVDYQWSPGTFTTGDATWADDAASLSMSMSGDPQKTTFADGSDAIAGDGNDYGLVNFPDLSTLVLGSTWEIEIQTTQTSQARIGVADGTGNFYFILNNNGNFSGGSGNIGVITVDDNNNILRYNADATGFNDGNKHILTFDMVDVASNSIDMYLDGSDLGASVGSEAQNPSSYSSFTDDWGFWAFNNNGTIQDQLTGSLGTIRVHGSGGVGPTLTL